MKAARHLFPLCSVFLVALNLLPLVESAKCLPQEIWTGTRCVLNSWSTCEKKSDCSCANASCKVASGSDYLQCVLPNKTICAPKTGACCLPNTCEAGRCGKNVWLPNKCGDGTVGGGTGICQYNATSATCQWLTRSCPALNVCPQSKCGLALGMPAIKCTDGSVGGNTGVCRLLADGKTCGWLVRTCPQYNCLESVTRFQCASYNGRFKERSTCAKSCAADPCATCRAWQVCDRSDAAVGPYCKDTCQGFPCGPGQFCRLKAVQCIRAPCPPVATCLTNKCITVKCTATTTCWPETGQCVDFSKCAAVTCLVGTQCNPLTGQCEVM